MTAHSVEANQWAGCFRIMACDRDEKYDELVKEFANHVRPCISPDLPPRTSAEILFYRRMYKFSATVTSCLAPAITSSTVLKRRQ